MPDDHVKCSLRVPEEHYWILRTIARWNRVSIAEQGRRYVLERMTEPGRSPM